MQTQNACVECNPFEVGRISHVLIILSGRKFQLFFVSALVIHPSPPPFHLVVILLVVCLCSCVHVYLG